MIGVVKRTVALALRPTPAQQAALEVLQRTFAAARNAIASAAHSLKAHRANGRPWMTVTFRHDASVHIDARTF